jgi:CheY-like chemotaxis protein
MENNFKKYKILVIEDDEPTRESIMIKIKKEGFDVDFAPDGEIGLEKIKNDSAISIILLDLRMPKMSGFEFLEKLKNDPKYSNLPVVIFTNSYEKEFMSHAKDLGVKGYLLKSNHNIQDIVNEVKKCLFDGSCAIDKIA